MRVCSITAALVVLLHAPGVEASPLSVVEVLTPTGLEDYVSIEGDVELGDSTKFLKLMRKGEHIAGVMLHSDGGSLDDGLAIAKFIYEHELDTMVTRNCHSVCAIMFLAGKERFIADGASLTFHSAYKQIGDWVIADNHANGTVAWFLGHMGYPLALARLWMNTPSSDAAPITLQMNEELGLGFTVVDQTARTGNSSGAARPTLQLVDR